jgi:hypothetical protein
LYGVLERAVAYDPVRDPDLVINPESKKTPPRRLEGGVSAERGPPRERLDHGEPLTWTRLDEYPRNVVIVCRSGVAGFVETVLWGNVAAGYPHAPVLGDELADGRQRWQLLCS